MFLMSRLDKILNRKQFEQFVLKLETIRILRLMSCRVQDIAGKQENFCTGEQMRFSFESYLVFTKPYLLVNPKYKLYSSYLIILPFLIIFLIILNAFSFLILDSYVIKTT